MMEIIINRTDGNIERPLESKDHVSGLLFYFDSSQVQGATDYVTTGAELISNMEELEEFFVNIGGSSQVITDIVTYNVREYFSRNPRGELYLSIATKPSGENLYNEIEQMQRIANGEIRQIGVWDFSVETSQYENTCRNLQRKATELEDNNMPLSILFAPAVSGDLPLISGSYKNVSIILTFDGLTPTAESVSKAVPQLHPSSLGLALGVLASIKVNESIASVKRARLNIKPEAVMFANGYRASAMSTTMMKQVDTRKYIYLKTYAGVDGVYFSDSHTLGSGDYNTIESVRTMDKAARGVRARLVRELGSPLYIDAETGRLDPATVKHLEITAGKELEAMMKAGEISGWSVEIDPNQDVLGTSTVEFVIKKVPVGVFRKGVINIGYTKKIGG